MPSPRPRMPSPPPPLAFHDELVRIVRTAAAPLLPGTRGKFYERVDALLREEPGPLGPGLIGRICAKAQREFVSAPDAATTVDGRR
jgi:hypothetical protein